MRERARVGFCRPSSLVVVIALGACTSNDGLKEDGASATVAAAGGRVSHGTGASVVVPANALVVAAKITVSATATPSEAELGAVPIGPAFALGPEGQVFLQPVTVVLPFEGARVPAGTPPHRLRVYTAAAGSRQWTTLPTTVDVLTSTLRAEVKHFSRFVPAMTRDVPGDAGIDAAEAGSPAPDAGADAADASTSTDAQPAGGSDGPGLLADAPGDTLPDAATTADAVSTADATGLDGRTPDMAPDVAPLPSGPLPVSPNEAVSRLARFLWKAAPDQMQLDRAAMGWPATIADARALATQMLADARARALPGDFVVWWLGLDRLNAVSLSAQLFPDWGPALATSMLTEARLFATDVVLDGRRGLDTLLTADYTFADPALRKLYGVPGTGAGFVKVQFPARQRAGILTLTAPNVLGTSQSMTSPPLRGMLVRERVLCHLVPPPPDGIIVTVPNDPRLTTRERYAQHAEDPACRACHHLIDPIGFGFEHYDALGRYRTTDNGKPVDASGAIPSATGEERFRDAVELGQKLAVNDEVRRCFARKWLEYALGRDARESDGVSIDRVYQAGAAAGWSIGTMIVETGVAPAFLAP